MSTPLQQVITRHWNQRAPSYLRNHRQLFVDNAVSRRWARVPAEFVDSLEPLNILDAGSGPGIETAITKVNNSVIKALFFNR